MESDEAAIFVDSYCETFGYVLAQNASVIPTVALDAISDNTLSEDASIKEASNKSLSLQGAVTIWTTIRETKLQQMYDSAALWAVEEFLKLTFSIEAANKKTINMSDMEKLGCPTPNVSSYIAIRDSGGNCRLDDTLRLEAAITKVILSFGEVILSSSSICVKVEKPQLTFQQWMKQPQLEIQQYRNMTNKQQQQQQLYEQNTSFPIVDFSL